MKATPMLMADLPRNQWYPLFLVREITQQPRKFERFGKPWVVCRLPDGHWFMASDRCPHLGASLTLGKIRGCEIECPFHGFRFDHHGHCTAAPAIGTQTPSARLQLEVVPLLEIQGWIWGWWGDPTDNYPKVPTFSEFDHQWRWGDIAADWAVHVTRAIENQLDVAHLPFVHRRSIGAGGRTLVEGPYIEADDAAIRIWVTNRRDEGGAPRSLEILETLASGHPPNLEFRYPGLWQLRIHPKLRLIVGFVPVNPRKTRFYVRACHQLRIPIIGGIYSRLLGLSNRWILGEDQRVVETIVPYSSMEADNDILIASDRAIVRFRKTWRKLIDSSRPE